ncbi:MAG: helix-turn-helix transcriptional regulator [Alphaproteobacteria bacterium]
MSNDIAIEKSSGNVFADLGIAEPEEAQAKAELARQISGIITQRRLSQVAAAKLLGIDQPKVSALMRGRLSGFSTERLIRFLNVLDRDVEIVVKPKPRSRRRGRIKVVAA